MEEWKEVAIRYKMNTQEDTLRDPSDIKRYFIERLCNKNKKPTGKSGPSSKVGEAQALFRTILSKEDCDGYGDNDDFDDEDNEYDSESRGEEDDADENDNISQSIPPSNMYGSVPSLGLGADSAYSLSQASSFNQHSEMSSPSISMANSGIS
jgi:hypothetical protein